MMIRLTKILFHILIGEVIYTYIYTNNKKLKSLFVCLNALISGSTDPI